MPIKSSKKNGSLLIEDIELKLKLGVTAKERQKKQKVLVSIKIDFAVLPLACVTEKISDAMCYDKLVNKVRDYCRNESFVLIENLCNQIFFLVKGDIKRRDKLRVSVAKLSPVKGLKQAVFEISD